jgi:hypothetical protein
VRLDRRKAISLGIALHVADLLRCMSPNLGPKRTCSPCRRMSPFGRQADFRFKP